MSKKYDSENAKAIEDYKKLLTDIITHQTEKFDQKTTFIASGAFTISAVFIQTIVPLNYALGRANLLAALSIFASVVVLSLIAHYTSILANSWARDKFEMIDVNDFKYIQQRWNFAIRLINYMTILLLIIGCVFLLYFVSINVVKL